MMPPTLVRKQQPHAALSLSDQKLLAELEAKVENSMMGFCVALAEIRDHKDGVFWKERYTSFQEYARARFGYGEQHTGRLIATGGFLLELENSKSKAPKPVRENQVRPLLNKLPAEHQIPCWEKITGKTPPSKLTGDIIEAQVVQYRKNIPAAELAAVKPERRPKKNAPPPDERARGMSHAWLEKLKASTAALPQAEAIGKLLDQVAVLVDRKK